MLVSTSTRTALPDLHATIIARRAGTRRPWPTRTVRYPCAVPSDDETGDDLDVRLQGPEGLAAAPAEAIGSTPPAASPAPFPTVSPAASLEVNDAPLMPRIAAELDAVRATVST